MDIPETLHTARVFLSLSESHTWNPLGEKINKYLDSVTKFRVCGRKGSFFCVWKDLRFESRCLEFCGQPRTVVNERHLGLFFCFGFAHQELGYFVNA